jgi:aldehyde dehydrogenase (NAD+)
VTGTVDGQPSDPVPLLIDGEPVDAADGGTFPVVDPATGEENARVAAGTAADIDRAVESARDAADAWAARDPVERGRVLRDVSAALFDATQRLARLETLDSGKPLSEARDDAESLARYFEYYAGLADKIHGETVPHGTEYVDYTVREPLGVTAHILPWNFPLLLFGRSVGPAVAAGNATVVKPAILTPRTAVEATRVAIDAGLPPGVINVVPGSGSEAGSALAGHEGVGGVSFTGSVPTGKAVGKAAVSNLNPVHLELGGNAPNVVFPDADFGTAVENALTAAFTNAGQACSAGPRLLVHRDVHDEFVEELAARAERLSLGPGIEDPDVGPVASRSQFESVTSAIASARDEVGEPVAGGEPLDRNGFFVEPTVFDRVDHDAEIARTEVFGPVLTVTTFADEAEAIALANDTQYGLVAGVFTENLGRAHRFARDIEAGVVYLNEWFSAGVGSPFGGYKNSGIGREAGREAVRGFTQTKSVTGSIGTANVSGDGGDE